MLNEKHCAQLAAEGVTAGSLQTVYADQRAQNR